MTYRSYFRANKAKFKSDAFEAIYSAAQGLHRVGTIDKATMRDFDESCLAAPVEIAPQEIKRILDHDLTSRTSTALIGNFSGIGLPVFNRGLPGKKTGNGNVFVYGKPVDTLA